MQHMYTVTLNKANIYCIYLHRRPWTNSALMFREREDSVWSSAPQTFLFKKNNQPTKQNNPSKSLLLHLVRFVFEKNQLMSDLQQFFQLCRRVTKMMSLTIIIKSSHTEKLSNFWFPSFCCNWESTTKVNFNNP